MYLSPAWLGLLLSALTMTVSAMGWLTWQLYAVKRALTERIPRLEGTVYGPPRPDGNTERTRGLEGKHERNAREVRRLRKNVKGVWEFLAGLPRGSLRDSSGVDDTGAHRVLTRTITTRMRELAVDSDEADEADDDEDKGDSGE